MMGEPKKVDSIHLGFAWPRAQSPRLCINSNAIHLKSSFLLIIVYGTV